MLVDFIRILFWVIACMLVAIIEYSTGLPILTITLILLVALSSSTIWFITFVSMVTILLASLFMESWLVIWLLMMIAALAFRFPSTKTRQTFALKISIIFITAIVLSLLRQPTVTFSFIVHSLISAGIAWYVVWRKVLPKTRGLDIAELRFMAEE